MTLPQGMRYSIPSTQKPDRLGRRLQKPARYGLVKATSLAKNPEGKPRKNARRGFVKTADQTEVRTVPTRKFARGDRFGRSDLNGQPNPSGRQDWRQEPHATVSPR